MKGLGHWLACGACWCCLTWNAYGAVRDSVVVDGNRMSYLAEVDIDTTWQSNPNWDQDWWIGVGWDFSSHPEVNSVSISTGALSENRPLLYVERQKIQPSGTRRAGFFAAYFQPWILAQDQISEDVKGWILASEKGSASPVQQVILTPDNLAPERDTLWAPLRPGHAFRLGICLEGKKRKFAYPRGALSVDAVRPPIWTLQIPQEPSTWPTTEPTQTLERAPWHAGRMRLELGAVLDLGLNVPSRRSSSQLRMSAYWVPQSTWGLTACLLVSPTRR